MRRATLHHIHVRATLEVRMPTDSVETLPHDIAGNGLVHPFAVPPETGRMLEVAPGVFWLRMPLPFALDHINLWLLADGEGWCLVDTGLDFEGSRSGWEWLIRDVLGGQPITRIIVTHYHPDHIGLARWLAGRYDCAVRMTAGEHAAATLVCNEDPTARSAFFRRHGLDEERLAAVAAWGASYRQNISGLPVVAETLQDAELLRIGGREWRVIVGRGHSPEHAALYCAALGVLISGDQILPRITSHVGVWHFAPEADPLTLYVDSLSSFSSLPADTLVLPAHGLPFTGLPARLAFLAHHHDRRLEEVLEACRTPRSAADIMPALFRRRLDAQQLPFAMSETIAHLNHLHQQGRLLRHVDASGIYRFEQGS